MSGVVHLPWYATGFRGDDLAAALEQLAPISLRYGAREHRVYRSRDDRYKMLMTTDWDSHAEWEAFWFGEEFTEMRAACSGWYQVPLLYTWQDLISAGALAEPVPTAGDERGDVV